MRELSLFTGAGGGILGTKLLGWTTLGYVEFNEYCQKVLSQRIKDGIFDEAPIFGDIRAFISEGYAASYTGMVDVITAGFPCQPFSVAGKQQGENDPRNMWPQTIECIRIVRPQFALLENVPGLLAHPYARRIFGDLAESGYDARWRVLSAAEVGASHKRDRLWIMAYDNHKGLSELITQRTEQQVRVGFDRLFVCQNRRAFDPAKAFIRRGVHGIPNRVDCIKALGNAQVPRVVATAWEILSADFKI